MYVCMCVHLGLYHPTELTNLEFHHRSSKYTYTTYHTHFHFNAKLHKKQVYTQGSASSSCFNNDDHDVCIITWYCPEHSIFSSCPSQKLDLWVYKGYSKAMPFALMSWQAAGAAEVWVSYFVLYPHLPSSPRTQPTRLPRSYKICGDC